VARRKSLEVPYRRVFLFLWIDLVSHFYSQDLPRFFFSACFAEERASFFRRNRGPLESVQMVDIHSGRSDLFAGWHRSAPRNSPTSVCYSPSFVNSCDRTG